MFRMVLPVIALLSAQAMADTYTCVSDDTGREVIIEASSYEILVIQDKQPLKDPTALLPRPVVDDCVPYVTYTNQSPPEIVYHDCD